MTSCAISRRAIRRGHQRRADSSPRCHPPPGRQSSTPTEGTGLTPARARDRHASEDCLFLNVWTPGCDATASRPVHGVPARRRVLVRARARAALYDGSAARARGDVVVVTLNHRLNAFGYLYLGATPQRRGVRRQRQLRAARPRAGAAWVRDNIAAFGGDPGQRDGVRPVGRRRKDRDVDGDAGRVRTVPSRRHHERPAGDGLRPAATPPRGTHAARRARACRRNAATSSRRLPLERLLSRPRTTPIRSSASGRLYFGPVLDERSLHAAPVLSGRAGAVRAHADDHRQHPRRDPVLDRPRRSRRCSTSTGTRWPRAWPTRCAWTSSPQLVVATSTARLYPHASPSDVFFAATTASRSWRGALIELEARCAAGRAHVRLPARFRRRPRTAADGAHSTGSTSRWSSATSTARGSLTGTADVRSACPQRSADAFVALARDGVPESPGGPEWSTYDWTTRDDGVRRSAAPRARSARRRAAPLRQGPLHPAGDVIVSVSVAS